ncbi:NUDIX domain-containing protein [Clostridium sp. CS001]|uniref:NUDIX domain-containing protein n=1 Tax=Clostridium sp. CS001 TaxID=2880648 RepID=UPI001CF46CE3|nr:NUDIX domain-containing protein [Clostridium sp. CS001]MCB2291730.1 NUDIX domain-containing protein [Clostridium sp. CS001]
MERAGVYGIAIDNEGKVATIKTLTGYFLPGGGIESGETNEECLEREFIEETGYIIKIGGYIGKASLYHLSKTNQYIHGTGYFYFVNLESKISNKIEEDHQLLWIESNECVESLFLKKSGMGGFRGFKV